MDKKSKDQNPERKPDSSKPGLIVGSPEAHAREQQGTNASKKTNVPGKETSEEEKRLS